MDDKENYHKSRGGTIGFIILILVCLWGYNYFFNRSPTYTGVFETDNIGIITSQEFSSLSECENWVRNAMRQNQTDNINRYNPECGKKL